MTIITKDISQAVTVLKQGGLVAMPTETVYGLAADARHEAAINAIFKAKKRPYDHPLIVHLAGLDQLSEWARDIPDAAYHLAKQFWPGPLTFILNKQPQVLDVVTGGQSTVGIRIPRHPVALAVLKAFGGGLAAPSANKFTHITPTTAQAVFEELNGAIDLILEGGDCEVGLESTILDLTAATPTILRPGMITAEMLSTCLNQTVVTRHKVETTQRVPGMHHLHYAPQTRTYVVSHNELHRFMNHLPESAQPLVLITHDRTQAPADFSHALIMLANDANHYAHELYRTLRECDHGQFKTIVISEVPLSPAWDAIRDRLAKASFQR
jgi:L-threonylcarbamoyladenylate synthase